MTYYTGIFIISLFSLGILSAIVVENARLSKSYKKILISTYVMIALAILAEWLGVLLDGAPMWTVPLHKIVKCADYTLSPMLVIFFCRQFEIDRKRELPGWILVCANAVIQIISIFTGWTVYVDDSNYYHHGKLFFIYVIVYVTAIIYVAVFSIQYSKKFSNQNRFSFFMILLLLFMGIAFQEIVSNGMRTFCITMVVVSILILLHTLEFMQLRTDDNIKNQQRLIDTDALTGLYSRYAYSTDIEKYEKENSLPAQLTVFSIDVNGLKYVNDSLGHSAGDEIIKGAAACMQESLGGYGKIYRTGGDEFIALLTMNRQDASKTAKKLEKVCSEWHGQLVESLSVSVGYALAEDFPNVGIEKLISTADKMMYRAKALYYSENGRDRRQN